MSKLDRKDIKIFSSGNASKISQIGAGRNGALNPSTDPDILQALSNYLQGLNEVVIASSGIPPAEDINALHFLTTRELAYIQQVGIPEYSTTTTYFAGKSIVRTPEDSTLYKSAIDDNLGYDIVGVAAYNAGTSYSIDDLAADTNGDIYRSLTNSNMGNPLTDPVNWELVWVFLGDLENLKNLAQATESVEGIAAIASQTEANTGINDSKFITPLKLKESIYSNMVFLSQTIASNQATVDIVLPTSDYDTFIILLKDVYHATNATRPRIRLSSDGGSTFRTGVSDYTYSFFGAGITTVNDDNESYIEALSESRVSNVQARNYSLAVKIRSASNALTYTNISWEYNGFDSDGAGAIFGSGGGFVQAATEVNNAIRFYSSSGNITGGTYTLYGIKEG